MSREMTMPLIIVLLVVCASSAIFAAGGRLRKEELVVTGRVVSYDQLVSLANITSAPQLQVLIVRVAKRVKGREESRYIKVVYKHMQNEAKLPSEVFDGKSHWRFRLMKAATQDHSCKGPLQGLKRTSGAETEDLPSDTSLPCYLLRPGDLKVYDKR